MRDREGVGKSADQRGELVDRQDEPAEEDRREQHQQRQLHRLPLRVRDDRDQEAEPERREQQQGDRQRQGERTGKQRHAQAFHEQHESQAADDESDHAEGTAPCPASTSAELTGAIRNSSITPLDRSRTSDIDTNVTARC